VELRDALEEWTTSRSIALSTFGNIKYWDVSAIDDFNHLFHGLDPPFNDDIGEWDTSSVINMAGLFDESYYFNQDISRWNTTSVTSMYQMFQYARAFDQDIVSCV
jgi:surface protein